MGFACHPRISQLGRERAVASCAKRQAARPRREFPPAEEFERRAAAGRNVRDPVGDAGLCDRRNRVPAAYDRRALTSATAFATAIVPCRERVDFEDAHRPVPGDRLGAADDFAIAGDGLRPDIEPHPIADRRIADLERFGRRSRFQPWRDDVIDGQLETQAARLAPAFDLARGVEQILLDQRLADRYARSP